MGKNEIKKNNLEPSVSIEAYNLEVKKYSPEELEALTNQIHQSTKTSFRKFSRIHCFLLSRFPKYYNWHLKPWSSRVNFEILALYVLILFSANVLFYAFPTRIKAATSFSTTINVSRTTAAPFNNDLLGGNLSPWGGFWPDSNKNTVINNSGLSLIRVGHGQKVNISMEELYPSLGTWNWDAGGSKSVTNQIAWFNQLNIPVLYTLNDEISSAMLTNSELDTTKIATAWAEYIDHWIDSGVNIKYVEIGNEVDIAPMEGIQRAPVFYKPITNSNANPHIVITNVDSAYSRRARVDKSDALNPKLYLERDNGGWQIERTIDLMNQSGDSKSYATIVGEIDAFPEWAATSSHLTLPTGSTRYSNYIAPQTTGSIAYNSSGNLSGFGDYLYIRDENIGTTEMVIYKDLYKKAYDAIKALHPEVKVGPFPAGQGSKSVPYQPYSEIFSSTSSYDADFFSYHAYSFGGNPANFAGISGDQTAAKQAVVDSTYKYDGTYKWDGEEPYTVQQKLADFGSPNTQLLVTEFNYDGLGQYSYANDMWDALYYSSVISKSANAGIVANTFWDIFSGSDTDEIIDSSNQLRSMGLAMRTLGEFKSSNRQVLSSSVVTDDKPTVLYQSTGTQETSAALLEKAKRVETMATKDASGNYKLLLLNKNMTDTHNTTVNLQGVVSTGTATANVYATRESLANQTPETSTLTVSSGSFSLTLPPASIAIVDVASVTLSEDVTPPTLSITNPAGSATVSGTVNVAANASDASGVSSVAFYIDNVLKTTDTSAPYEYSWDTTAATNASHNIKAIATDAASLTAEQSISVTVNNSQVGGGGGGTFDGPVVSFAFDDGNKAQYTNFYPALEGHNYSGSVYVNTDAIAAGNTEKMSLANLDDLKNQGWEISSHGSVHSNTVTSVTTAKTWLEANGFPDPGYAAPGGATGTPEVEAAVRETYPYNRLTGWGIGNLPVADPYSMINVTGIEFLNETTLASRISLLDQLQTRGNGWIIFMCHGTDLNMTNFNTIVQAVADRNLPVMTVKEVLAGGTPPASSHTLTYSAAAHGSITGSTPQTVDTGASGSAVTATADTGYHFTNWSDGATANPRTDTNVQGNITVTANFAVNTYTVSATVSGTGTVTGAGTFNYGGATTLTANAGTGYHFTSWEGDCSGTTNPYSLSGITANKTCTANFVINSYTLAYIAGTHGSITGTASQSVNYGSSGSAVTAVADVGYHFVNWSDNSTANPRTDANIHGNLSVTANFAVNTYTVTFVSNGGASVAALSGINYDSPASAPTAPTKVHNAFAGWYKESGLTSEWNFDSDRVMANTTLYAKWTPTYDITAADTDHSEFGGTIKFVESLPVGVTGVNIAVVPGESSSHPAPTGKDLIKVYDITAVNQNGESVTTGFSAHLLLDYPAGTDSIETGYHLMFWNGTNWVTTGLSNTSVDTAVNKIAFDTNHLTEFAVFRSQTPVENAAATLTTVVGNILPESGLDQRVLLSLAITILGALMVIFWVVRKSRSKRELLYNNSNYA